MSLLNLPQITTVVEDFTPAVLAELSRQRDARAMALTCSRVQLEADAMKLALDRAEVRRLVAVTIADYLRHLSEAR